MESTGYPSLVVHPSAASFADPSLGRSMESTGYPSLVVHHLGHCHARWPGQGSERDAEGSTVAQPILGIATRGGPAKVQNAMPRGPRLPSQSWALPRAPPLPIQPGRPAAAAGNPRVHPGRAITAVADPTRPPRRCRRQSPRSPRPRHYRRCRSNPDTSASGRSTWTSSRRARNHRATRTGTHPPVVGVPGRLLGELGTTGQPEQVHIRQWSEYRLGNSGPFRVPVEASWEFSPKQQPHDSGIAVPSGYRLRQAGSFPRSSSPTTRE